MSLDQFAEEIVDCWIARIRSNVKHRTLLKPKEAERVRQVFAETKNVAETARRTKISQYHVRNVLLVK